MKRIMTRMSAIVLAVAVVAMSAGCGAQPIGSSAVTEPVPEGILVTTASPERGDMQLDTSFVGTVQPEQIVSVVPKMMGIVKTVNVSSGQVVKKGDLLMTLDDKDILPSVRQAEAAYNSAQAQVKQMTGSSYKSGLANLDSAYDQAYDTHENAKDKLQQLEDLKTALPGMKAPLEAKEADSSITVQEAAKLAELRQTELTIDGSIEAADMGVDTARKYFNNARNSYSAMKTEGQEDMQGVADATLASAEAGLNSAKAQLDNTKVYAPIDGVIESVGVTALNPASTSAPAFVISNKEALSASFNVPSASIAALTVGDKVTVLKGSSSYLATITEVSTMINQQTGLFTVKASLEAADASELLTGVMVKVTASTQRSENTILLSQDSVYFSDGKAYVYLAVSGRAVKTFIETGISNPKQIEVVEGVTDSDLIITSWHPDLIDGALIVIAR